MQQAHRPHHLQPRSQPTAICSLPVATAEARASSKLSTRHAALLWATSPKSAGCVTTTEPAAPGTEHPPPQGCKSKQPSERVRLSRTLLSGSHGCGWGCCRPQPRSAAARDRLPLRSPSPTAPGQHHGIKGRREQSPGGLPHSCNEFVGALLSLAVPWERRKPSLAPRHSCRGALSKTSATNGKRLLSKTPRITCFSHGSPASPKGNLQNKGGWLGGFWCNPLQQRRAVLALPHHAWGTRAHTSTVSQSPRSSIFFTPCAFAQVSFYCCQRGARGRTSRGPRSIISILPQRAGKSLPQSSS